MHSRRPGGPQSGGGPRTHDSSRRPRPLPPPPGPSPIPAHRVPYAGVAATDLPDASQLPAPDPLSPRVLLLDLPASLSLRLVDTRWRVVPPGWGRAEVVVAPVANVPDLQSVQDRCPSAVVLAVLPAAADSGLVVTLLDAGASACVRGSSADDVAAHLVALTRRLVGVGVGVGVMTLALALAAFGAAAFGLWVSTGVGT